MYGQRWEYGRQLKDWAAKHKKELIGAGVAVGTAALVLGAPRANQYWQRQPEQKLEPDFKLMGILNEYVRFSDDAKNMISRIRDPVGQYQPGMKLDLYNVLLSYVEGTGQGTPSENVQKLKSAFRQTYIFGMDMQNKKDLLLQMMGLLFSEKDVVEDEKLFSRIETIGNTWDKVQ